jgi:hypothetical protein
MRDGLELADRALATVPENARFGTLLGHRPYRAGSPDREGDDPAPLGRFRRSRHEEGD